MRIGGGGKRPFRTPNTSGIADRVEKTIRHLAFSHNARMSTAVSIDSPDFVVFNKLEGSVGCTCTVSRLNTDRFDSLGSSQNSSNEQDDGFEIYNPSDDSGAGVLNARQESPYPTIDPDSDEAAEMDLDPLDIGGVEDYENLEIDSDVLTRLKGIQPATYGDTVKCFVCIGASRVNAWRPFRGERIVLSFTDKDQWRHNNAASVDHTTRPNRAELTKGDWIEWDVKLPKQFVTCLRFQVWKDAKPVVPVTASLYRKDIPNTRYPVTVADLNRMNGSLSGEWVLRLDAHDTVDITHVEFQFYKGDWVKGQMPPLEVPYDHDYYDYNLTTTVEFAADVSVKEGELLAENKFGRLWRVTAVNRKALADGTGFGVQVDVRVVQPKEVYYLLNPFLKDDFNYKLFLGQNTTAEYKLVRT